MKLERDFTKLPNEFINDMPNLSHKAVRIYIALRKHINENKNGDEVFPSYTTLQKVTGLNRTSVARGLKELLNLGWIKKVDKGYNSVNHYHLSTSRTLQSKNLGGTKSVPVEDTCLHDKAESVVHKMDSTGTQSGLSVVHKVNSNNTNLTKLNNNIENPVIENPKGFSQTELGKVDSSKKENIDIHSMISNLFPPFDADTAYLGDISNNLINNDSSTLKADTAFNNSDEEVNLNPDTKFQKKFLEKCFTKEFKRIEDKQLFQKIEKNLVGEALFVYLITSKNTNYYKLLDELEEYLPEFFRKKESIQGNSSSVTG